MTTLERDILAVLLSLNTVFMILVLPGIVPIDYSYDFRGLLFTTLAWGLPLGAIGVWVNHRYSGVRSDPGKQTRPPDRT